MPRRWGPSRTRRSTGRTAPLRSSLERACMTSRGAGSTRLCRWLELFSGSAGSRSSRVEAIWPTFMAPPGLLERSSQRHRRDSCCRPSGGRPQARDQTVATGDGDDFPVAGVGWKHACASHAGVATGTMSQPLLPGERPRFGDQIERHGRHHRWKMEKETVFQRQPGGVPVRVVGQPGAGSATQSITPASVMAAEVAHREQADCDQGGGHRDRHLEGTRRMDGMVAAGQAPGGRTIVHAAAAAFRPGEAGSRRATHSRADPAPAVVGHRIGQPVGDQVGTAEGHGTSPSGHGGQPPPRPLPGLDENQHDQDCRHRSRERVAGGRRHRLVADQRPRGTRRSTHDLMGRWTTRHTPRPAQKRPGRATAEYDKKGRDHASERPHHQPATDDVEGLASGGQRPVQCRPSSGATGRPAAESRTWPRLRKRLGGPPAGAPPGRPAAPTGPCSAPTVLRPR